MIFRVERTSDPFHESKPIEESYLGKCLDLFPGAGKEKKEKSYLVEVDTIEGLIDIVDKYGTTIIYQNWCNYPTLEIYDDYRE